MLDAVTPGVGHNSNAIEIAAETFRDVSAFLVDHPAIVTHEDAKAAKLQLDRLKSTKKDLDEAEGKTCDPLYRAWKDAKAVFAPALENLKAIEKQLSARIQSFLEVEEARRALEALEARRKAEEALEAARAAALAEQEAIENAAGGEYGVDVGAAIVESGHAFAEAAKAQRAADVAARDADNVRLSGGFQRAVSVKTVKKPVVTDPQTALAALGLTDKIRDALIQSARAYKQLRGSWPPGITEIEERTL